MKERFVGSATIVELKGRLTWGEGSEPLSKKLQSLVAGGHPNLLLECSQVSSIDSTGIHALVRCSVTAQKREGKLKLLNLSPHMRMSLTFVGLLKVIEAFDDEATALASLEQ